MSEAIQKLKLQIKSLVEEKKRLRTEVSRLRAKGPETGSERHHLKQGYNRCSRPIIRANYLAYGLLRGRTYASIEANSDSAPSAHQILKVLHLTGLEDWSIAQVTEWLETALRREEAA